MSRGRSGDSASLTYAPLTPHPTARHWSRGRPCTCASANPALKWSPAPVDSRGVRVKGPSNQAEPFAVAAAAPSRGWMTMVSICDPGGRAFSPQQIALTHSPRA